MSEPTERESESHEPVRNVVLVVLDTARATSVSERTMPTLTALAAEGTTFERAYSSAPWTLPSHASLFTGTRTSEHGAHGGHTYLSGEFRTVAEAFSDAGYETVGVSNNTWITEEFGFDRGFDQLRRGWQYLQSETDMGTVVRAEHLGWKLESMRERLFEGNPLVNAANVLYSEVIRPQGDDGADRATTWATEWLEDREDDRPFFLFCNYLEPHVEYDPPEEHARRFLPEGTYEEATAIRQDPRAYDCEAYDLTEREFDLLRGLYRAELAYVDDQLGRLRDALEASGQWEKTLLVVCGDHGENVGDHGFFGHQYNLYDSLLHVPLVCHGGPFSDDSRTDLVQLLDVPTSLLEAAGIEDDAFDEQGQGRSLLAGASEPREAVLAEYVSPQPEIERLEDRFGDLPERVYGFDRGLRAIRTHEYKYVTGDGFERLHDVRTDPLEGTDLSAERPEVAEELRERLEHRLDGLEAGASDGSVEMRESTKDRLADLGYL